MIHILTIHWNNDLWIDIQLKYLKQYIKQPFKVYSFLNNIKNPAKHQNKFFYSSTENIKSHAIKLNLLADMACLAAKNEEDLLIFIDGDAFPIADLSQLIKSVPLQYNLAAVQRLDNDGDIQPHPCFCITSVKFWKHIQGDWKPGNVKWTNALGEEIADVGGKLMHQLNKNKQNWYKMNRTNKHNLHPVMFGVYDHLIYHHGAGFRSPGIRIDKKRIKFYKFKSILFGLFKKILPFKLAKKLFFPLNSTIKTNQSNSEIIYQNIVEDFNFYEKLK